MQLMYLTKQEMKDCLDSIYLNLNDCIIPDKNYVEVLEFMEGICEMLRERLERQDELLRQYNKEDYREFVF